MPSRGVRTKNDRTATARPIPADASKDPVPEISAPKSNGSPAIRSVSSGDTCLTKYPRARHISRQLGIYEHENFYNNRKRSMVIKG